MNNPFRIEELRYKNRNKPVDLSRVIDHRSGKNMDMMTAASIKWDDNDFSKEYLEISGKQIIAYEIKRFPGLFIIPSLLSAKIQWILARDAIIKWSRRTNLDTHYDFGVPQSANASDPSVIFNLWKEEMAGGEPRQFQRLDLDETLRERKEKHSASKIIRKLRWALFGMEYNWDKKEYTKVLGQTSAVPPFLRELSNVILRPLASHIGYHHLPFEPQVGIVNYYGDKDSLTAHIDRSENNMDAPLISFNVGKSCVFLIGNEEKDVEPSALIIHSGDVVIMSKGARKSYHGVPRILETTSHLPSCPLDVEFDTELEREMVKSHLSNIRININLRQANIILENDGVY